MSRTRAYDLVVIGAGAAGLWAAIQAARAASERVTGRAARRDVPPGAELDPDAGPGACHLRVALLDRREKVAAKILMSGGTRCNLTHCEVFPADYRGGNRNRIARVLRAHPASESLRVFTEELGVAIKQEPGGKIFPADDKATTVRDALLAAIDRAAVPLLRGRRWCGLEPISATVAGAAAAATVATSAATTANTSANTTAVPTALDEPAGPRVPRWRILIRDDADRPLAPIETARVLVATGGCSFPESGSDGSGYAILRELGHTVVEPLPALTPLRLGSGFHAELSGIATPVRLELRVDGKLECTAEGPLLWTHSGVSGPAALDLSGPWARAHHERPEAEIRVFANFLPEETTESAEAGWLAGAAHNPARTIRAHLSSLPHRLSEALVRTAGADPVQPLAQTARALRRAVIAHLVRFPLPVEGVLGFHKAEVTSGGVPLEEVDQGLESRILPGVHFAGEVLNVDGRLGGFNFQWAWSSGTVAARAAVARLLSPD
jgi:predicted flavoprotein YhiN